MSWPLWIVAILGIGALVAFHELGHHLVALWTGMRVRRFSVGFGPALINKRHNGIEYTVGALPLGGFVDIVGMNPLEEEAHTDPRSYQRRPLWARALVVVAGPAFNYALAVMLCFGVLYATGSKPTEGSRLEFQVTQVLAGSGAAAAGIQTGDVITAVDGQALGASYDLRQTIVDSQGKTLNFTLRRGDQQLQVSPSARQEGETWKLGIAYQPQRTGNWDHFTVVEAAVMSVGTVFEWTWRTLDQMAGWFRPGGKVQVGGPPAIVDELKQSLQRGWKDFVTLLALVSAMLGLFNLFPIPPLDGSRLVLVGVEAISRRRVPARLQLYVFGLGMVLMLSLMVIISIGDVRERFLNKPEVAPSAQPAAPATPAP